MTNEKEKGSCCGAAASEQAVAAREESCCGANGPGGHEMEKSAGGCRGGQAEGGCACEGEQESAGNCCGGGGCCDSAAWEACPQCGSEEQCDHFNSAGEPVATEEQMVEFEIGAEHRSVFLDLKLSLDDIGRLSQIHFEGETMRVEREIAAQDPRITEVMMLLSEYQPRGNA